MDIGVSEYGIYPEKIPIRGHFNVGQPCMIFLPLQSHAIHQMTGPFMPCTYQNPGLTKQQVGFLEKATRTSWWNQHLNTKGSGSLCSLKAILRQFHIRSLKSGSCFVSLRPPRWSAILHPTWRNTLLIGRFRYVRGMVIPPLMGFWDNGYVNLYWRIDDNPKILASSKIWPWQPWHI